MRFLLLCLLSISCFGMSLEEKVGQVLMVHFQGQEANDDAKTLVQDVHVGGFIYYNWANGLTSPEQVKALSAGLQKLAKVPLFIAADQEGGVVARLSDGFAIFPGNKALAMAGDPQLAEQSAFAMGQELQAVGVNFNLAPVVDVNINPRNPIIGIRSFGESPETVTIFGGKAISGYRKAGIITSLKHFPGHGDVEVDSHHALPVVNKSKEQLSKVELYPFAQLAPEADTIMTAHLLVPALDPDHCSTLSKKTLDFLRQELKFKGVIISDSLVMEGVLKQTGLVDEAAIQALNAGCDILMLGGKQLIEGGKNLELTTADVKRIHGALVEAVKKGRIPEARLNQAVERVQELKFRYLHASVAGGAVNTPEHRALAQKIASQALRVNKGMKGLAGKKIAVIAPAAIKNNIPKNIAAEMIFFEGLNPDPETVVKNSADVVIFCSYNSWKNPGQKALIEAVQKTGKPLILLVVRDPLDAELYQADAVISTFSPTAPALQTAFDQIFSSF